MGGRGKLEEVEGGKTGRGVLHERIIQFNVYKSDVFGDCNGVVVQMRGVPYALTFLNTWGSVVGTIWVVMDHLRLAGGRLSLRATSLIHFQFAVSDC